MENKEIAKTEGRSERGASMVEYALLVSLIAVVAIAGVSLLGGNINQTFQGIAGQIQPPAGAGAGAGN